MRSMSQREFDLWQLHLDREWDRPSRADHYAMQAAMETTRARVKHPGSVRLDHFRIRFRRPGEDLDVRLDLPPDETGITRPSSIAAVTTRGQSKNTTVVRISKAEHRRRLQESTQS